MLSASFESEGLSFRQAASKGDLSELIRLYNGAGKEILEQCGAKSGKTALHQAAMKNREKIVETLISWGANLNCTDALGNTPLILAYQNQSFKVANYLLDQDNLDVLHKNNEGKNALMVLPPEGKAKFMLLHNKVMQKLTSQVHRLVESGASIRGIDMKPNGEIELIGDDIEKLSQKIAASSNNVYSSYQEGDLRLLKSKEGVCRDLVGAHDFKVPPLVFLMSHNDPIVFDRLKKNFNYLKQCGYKAICLELDSDISLEKTISILRETANDAKQIPLDDRIVATQHADFIEDFTRAGLNYHGVDESLGVLRHPDALDLTRSKVVMEVRNAHIAKMVAKYANQYNGGVIVLLGTAHVNFLDALKIHNKGTTDPFIVYQVYNNKAFIPVGESLEEKLLRLRLTSSSDIISIDCSKLNETDQQEKFVQPIREFLEHHVTTQRYSRQVDTHLVKKLQLLHAEFKGMLRESNEGSPEYLVDAVLSVSDPKVYKLQALVFKELMGITTKLRYVQDKDETRLSLVIEDINGSSNGEIINKLSSLRAS